MNPPTVCEETRPSTHRMIRIIAMVSSMLLLQSSVQFHLPWHPGLTPIGQAGIRPGSALDSGNFGAFDTEAGHQSLLVKNERVGIVLQCR